MSVVSQLKTRGLPLQLAPESFAAELAAWIEFGCAPADPLLRAILTNDLHATVAYAGVGQWMLIRAAFHWLCNFAPPECFGSQATVHTWERRGGMNGRRLQ